MKSSVLVSLDVAERIAVYLSAQRQQRARRLAAWRGVSRAFAATIPPQLPTNSSAVLATVLEHKRCDDDLRHFLLDDPSLYCNHFNHYNQTQPCPDKQGKRAAKIWHALFRSRYPDWDIADVKLHAAQHDSIPMRRLR